VRRTGSLRGESMVENDESPRGVQHGIV